MNSAPSLGLSPDELRFVVVGPEWRAWFEEERVRLEEAFGSSALDIQHIGSTAIPGITAKPILDIAVTIRDFESGHALVPSIVPLGYGYLGENGIPRRHFFVRGGTHHLHVFEQDGSDWKRHLRFRDRLLASPELAARYSEIKLAAANDCGGDRERYQALKRPFIEAFQHDDRSGPAWDGGMEHS